MHTITIFKLLSFLINCWFFRVISRFTHTPWQRLSYPIPMQQVSTLPIFKESAKFTAPFLWLQLQPSWTWLRRPKELHQDSTDIWLFQLLWLLPSLFWCVWRLVSSNAGLRMVGCVIFALKRYNLEWLSSAYFFRCL